MTPFDFLRFYMSTEDDKYLELFRETEPIRRNVYEIKFIAKTCFRPYTA